MLSWLVCIHFAMIKDRDPGSPLQLLSASFHVFLPPQPIQPLPFKATFIATHVSFICSAVELSASTCECMVDFFNSFMHVKRFPISSWVVFSLTLSMHTFEIPRGSLAVYPPLILTSRVLFQLLLYHYFFLCTQISLSVPWLVEVVHAVPSKGLCSI